MIIIDRIEGRIAVLETDEGITEISAEELPSDAAEGDILVNSGGEWRIDREATEQRRALVSNKLKRLMKGRND